MDDEIARPRAFYRKRRAREQTAELLKPLFAPDITGVIQCGLGDWAEGPVLLEKFPHANFFAVEPVTRYAHGAWQAGFRGPIMQAALWSETGLILDLNDYRSRTSMLDRQHRPLGKFQAHTVRLDDACEWIGFQSTSILLWMDCEGVELEILKGATGTLKNTTAIVIELKDKPRLPNWPKTDQVVEALRGYGFTLAKRVTDNGLFLRPA